MARCCSWCRNFFGVSGEVCCESFGGVTRELEFGELCVVFERCFVRGEERGGGFEGAKRVCTGISVEGVRDF